MHILSVYTVCVCVCVPITYVHNHPHLPTPTHTHTRTHTHTHTHTHTYTHTHTHTHTHAHTHIRYWMTPTPRSCATDMAIRLCGPRRAQVRAPTNSHAPLLRRLQRSVLFASSLTSLSVPPFLFLSKRDFARA
jgi:ABC-type Zn2+ transport system substrate-binding protein/surface adhesin